MGISINLFKKGINYVLKSSQNGTPKSKLSVFEGVEGTSVKNLTSVFETKVPLKQGVTNPFDSVGTFSCDYLSADARRKNVATFLRYLDSLNNKKLYTEQVNSVREMFSKHPEIMQTLPAEDVNFGFLTILSKNPSAWKPEFGAIPFDKIKSSQADSYLRSILQNNKQAVHSFDPKSCLRTFGQKGHNGTINVFDFSHLKSADGSYEPSKLADYIDYLKSAEAVENPDLIGLSKLFENASSGKEVVQKYPKSIEFMLNNFVDKTCVSPYSVQSFTFNRFAQIENLLNSGIDITCKKYVNINQLIGDAGVYNFIVSNPKLSALNKEEISKACDVFNSLRSGFFSCFLTAYSPEVQGDLIKLAIKLSPEERKYFDFLVKNKSYSELSEKILEKPELLSEISKNKSRIGNIIPDSKSCLYRQNVIDQLAIMKTYYPSEYYSLAKTQGFKDILAGYLDVSVLKDVKYNSSNEYFNNLFANLENSAMEMPVYKELSPQMQEVYMNVAMYDPASVTTFNQIALQAKDNAVFCKALKRANNSAESMKKTIAQMKEGGYYLEPKDLKSSRENILEFLNLAATKPEEMKKALKFAGNPKTYSKLVKNLEKNVIPDDVQKILFEHSDKFSASSINSVADYISANKDNTILRDILGELAFSNRIKASDMSYILDNISENNAQCIKSILQHGGYDNILNVQRIAYFTKDIKEFSQVGNQAQILKSLDEIIAVAKGDMRGRNYQTIKNLIELRTSHPEKYQELEQSGILDYIRNTNEPISILGKINGNAKLSPDLLADLKLWKEGKSIVPEFSAGTPLKEVMSKTKTGDVVEIGDKLFINDGKEMYKWDMTKDMYLELFPPVKRFITLQQAIGDCYLVSSLNSIMQNPQARANLYKSFKFDGNEVKCTINAYKDFKGTTAFERGIVKLDDKNTHLYGCKGLQMLEQSYARSALREFKEDPLSTASEVSPHKLMSRICAGWTPQAESELLGLNYNPQWLKELPKDLDKSALKFNNTELIDPILETYGQNKNYLLNFGTVSKQNSTAESNLLSEYSIVSNHAYSILNYDKDKQLVTIANPHNASLIFDIPLDTLKKYIAHIDVTSLA